VLSRLRGKFARLVAVLVLMAGLFGASMPGFAAMSTLHPPKPMQAGADCDHATHHPTPPRGPSGDCCMVNICAMNLALPTAPSSLTAPVVVEMRPYDLRALRQPPGIVTAPIPHPPKVHT
jgi:hypothetical protein